MVYLSPIRASTAPHLTGCPGSGPGLPGGALAPLVAAAGVERAERQPARRAAARRVGGRRHRGLVLVRLLAHVVPLQREEGTK